MLLIAAAVVLIVLAVAVVSYPLVLQPAEPYALPKAPRSEFSERDALLDAIDDLEHAFHSGKLSQADYAAQRAQLEVQYVAVLEAAETRSAPRGGTP
ncbi:MAG TPA: hypothetical protein VF678_15450 [bacterium]